MRDDQFLKLQVMSERLTDVLFDEIDPDHWPAAGKKPAELTKDERGDRYWSKKNAAATLTLITKVASLVNVARQPDSLPPTGETEEAEGDMDKEIAAAEKEAAKLLDQAEKQRREREFKNRTLGKHGAH